MALKEEELRNTILKKISIDEFEPKTGDADKVMVIGFYVIENAPGEDLYKFINNSVIDIRDVEVSPNPNEDDYYMVFLEIDRQEGALDIIKEILKEVERVSGKLDWQIKSVLQDEYMSINDPELGQYIQTDPNTFMDREEFYQHQDEAEAEETEVQEEETALEEQHNDIISFLRVTDLAEAVIKNNVLTIGDTRNSASLEIISYGNGKDVLGEMDLTESAIRTDSNMRADFSRLDSMLGKLSVVHLKEYIVIFNPFTEKVLITKQV